MSKMEDSYSKSNNRRMSQMNDFSVPVGTNRRMSHINDFSVPVGNRKFSVIPQSNKNL